MNINIEVLLIVNLLLAKILNMNLFIMKFAKPEKAIQNTSQAVNGL